MSTATNTYDDLCEVIPGGVNSPVRAFKSLDIAPMIASKGEGDLLYNEQGDSFIDYCCSWGALIHGHAHPMVLKAVEARLKLGSSFGMTTAIEGELAEEIVNIIPNIEKIRFVNSGTEATMSAVRLARGYTGRELIIKFTGNYHGHSDAFLVAAGSGVAGLNSTSSSLGVTKGAVKDTICVPYNDIAACKELMQDASIRENLAAVILEPIAGNMGVVPASDHFIHYLREMTNEVGALLIFDEVINGFRVGLRGAQEFYRVKADMVCLGKVIGGGFPIAAFASSAEIMDHLAPLGGVYQAGTLSGNPVAIQAGLTAVQMLQTQGFYTNLESKANTITDSVREAFLSKGVVGAVQQVGSMFTIFFGVEKVDNFIEAQSQDVETFNRFYKYMYENGVFLPPSAYETWCVSAAHTEEHLVKTAELICDFIESIAQA